MKIGLLREGKNPPDRRVPFSPVQCKIILDTYSDISLAIQPSEIRCFSDLEYKKNGVDVQESLSDCDIIMGVKEVPLNMLVDNKIFLFFSHTIKKQPYNQNLLKTIIAKNIQLIDYETLIDEHNKRIIGFGRYAGIVGAYNSFLAYGKKSKTYDLKPPQFLNGKNELENELLKVKLPKDFKIILTGGGRVASGVVEVFKVLNVKKIEKDDFLHRNTNHPSYVQLMPIDYHEKKDGSFKSKKDFYNNPNNYKASLLKFCCQGDMLITGHYYHPNSPILLSAKDIQNKFFSLKVIGDISCDIAGPIASTIRPSTIEDPLYGYNRLSAQEDDYLKEGVLVVMAVDNLPCSLPKDASSHFGNVFIHHILQDLIEMGPVSMKGSITLNGSLTDRFKYLSDYVS